MFLLFNYLTTFAIITYDCFDDFDALAAAYAAREQFSLAESTGEKALTIASRTKNEDLADEIRERLELYKQHKPYTEDPNDPDVPEVPREEPKKDSDDCEPQ